MADWASGYVTDINYTSGFYGELTPSRLSYTALALATNAVGADQPLQYCELGCGQGFSANLLAAANPHVQFHATDFNPSQIAGANILARDAALPNVKFYDQSFADFLESPDIPDKFDIVALHGIYSWISIENRMTIVEFLRRKLKIGGLAYVSYNCLPGWSAAAPMRHLLYLHGKTTGGSTLSRLGPAIDFVSQVKDSNAAFFRANPAVAERFDKVRSYDKKYVAHEYLNDSWNLLYHSDVADEMSGAKLSYLGSAALLEQIDAIALTAEQQKVMASIQDSALKETVRDFMTNQQFRRDIFIKGPSLMTVDQAHDAWLNQRFALSTPREDITLKMKVAQGELTLDAKVYEPILDQLASGPITLREMLTNSAVSAISGPRLRQAMATLVGTGNVQPCLPKRDDGRRAKSTKPFNSAVIQRAKGSADLGFLASPVTGGGVAVGRFPQLFLLAIDQGRKQPAEWAEFAWQILAAQGQRILKDGKAIEAVEENVAELNAQARTFAEKQLPVLKALGVA